jgi:hypothetical protein
LPGPQFPNALVDKALVVLVPELPVAALAYVAVLALAWKRERRCE